MKISDFFFISTDTKPINHYGFDYPVRHLETRCRDMYYGFLVLGRFVRDNYRPT
jgi:hypothetical protein